jgi:hypothetical protein
MNKKEANQITGGLSKPSKMPGFSYNLPATRCKTGAKLAKVPGSVCHGCYALKGRYRFRNVKEAMERRYQAAVGPIAKGKVIQSTQWIFGMVYLIQSSKEKVFRWHDSGDIQSKEHLKRIFQVCELTPEVRHWLPTREAGILSTIDAQSVPDNLIIRLSATKVDGPAPKSWPWTSTVVTAEASCPAPKQDNQCKDCRACWDKEIQNVSYGKH